jgi:hypothetical protein
MNDLHEVQKKIIVLKNLTHFIQQISKGVCKKWEHVLSN